MRVALGIRSHQVSVVSMQEVIGLLLTSFMRVPDGIGIFISG